MSGYNLWQTCLLVALSTAVSSACAGYSPGTAVTDHRDISKVNGGVDLAPGSLVGDVSSVNGGVDIGAHSQADDVSNVNGGIRLGEGDTVKDLNGVNGGISAANNLHVNGNIATVNGGLHLGSGAQITGDLASINGGIDMDRAHIAGKVEFYNGIVDLGRGTTLDHGITAKKSRSWSAHPSSPARIIVGPDSVVTGDIVLERETEVFVHPSAKIGRVVGGTATVYTGEHP